MPITVSTYKNVSNMLSDVNGGGYSVGAIFQTIGYDDHWQGDEDKIPSGGNMYELMDASPGTRPSDDGGSVLHLTTSPTQYLKGLFPDGFIFAEQFGALGFGGTTKAASNLTAINNAIKYVKNDLYFGPGDFYVSGEILVERDGIALLGSGAGAHSNRNNFGTAISGTSEIKSVIRIKKENCTLKDILIKSESDRKSASINTTNTNYNCGIRVEADDGVVGFDVFSTVIENVHVYEQPCDGIALISRCYRSRLTAVTCDLNGRHGYLVSNGSHTSPPRDSLIVGAIIDFEHCLAESNKGHGWKVGDKIDDYSFRINMINCESLNNGTEESLLLEDSDSFFNCDGYIMLNGAFKSRVEGDPPVQVNAGATFMGRGGTLIEPRILRTTAPVRVMENTTSGRATEGWSILDPHIRGSVSSDDETLSSYLVFVDNGVENVRVWGGDNYGPPTLVDATSRTNVVGLDSYYKDKRILNTVVTTSTGPLLTPWLNLNNVAVSTTAVVLFDASTQGKMWVVYGRHIGVDCFSSFSCEIVGGTTPVISNVVNQAGAAVSYVLSVAGTDITLATSAGSRTTDIVVMEVVTA